MGNANILIADDHEAIGMLLSKQLKGAGYRAITAGDGKKALDIIIAKNNTLDQIDLLLTDIMMPNMNGLELIDALNNMDIKIPVIAITDLNDKDTVVGLLRRGVFDYFEKPFEREHILSGVKTVLEKKILKESKEELDLKNKLGRVFIEHGDESLEALLEKLLEFVFNYMGCSIGSISYKQSDNGITIRKEENDLPGKDHEEWDLRPGWQMIGENRVLTIKADHIKHMDDIPETLPFMMIVKHGSFDGSVLIKKGNDFSPREMALINTISSFLAFMLDIKLNLEKSREQLIQSKKMASLGQLVAGVAHEINTPVGIGITVSSHLKKRTETILNSYENKKMSKNDLEKYFKETLEISDLILHHLTQTANLVKSFKMISVDQSVHENRVFNVKSYLENIVKSLGPELKKKGHTVQVTCEDGLEINNCPGVLSQVVINLVMNSIIHAYDENEKEGQIKMDVCRKKDMIIIKYRDDGKGMSKDIVNRIFDPFFTTKRGEGGSGLGMHIVYNSITQILMGKIECESTPDIGTCFKIQIPVDINKEKAKD